MWGLIISTIITSAADSLNPIAITQQFVLQGMVKKPKHIWYFIIPTGVVNLASGYLAYYGLLSLIGDYFAKLIDRHGRTVFTLELILGIAFLIGVCHILENAKIDSLKKQVRLMQSGEATDHDEDKVASKIKSVSPLALIALGVGATISELATALPYFAFLAILFSNPVSFLEVTILLVVYNLIYMSPLMALYFVYVKAQDKFDLLYTLIKKQITKCSNILAPTVVGAIGVFLVFHSVSLLLK